MEGEEEEEHVSKKKKSGFAFRQERKNKMLNESAQQCFKITNFYSAPKTNHQECASTSSTQADEEKNTSFNNNVASMVTDSLDDSESKMSQSVFPPECAGGSGIKRAAEDINSLNEEMDYFRKPAHSDLQLFLSYHPIQPDVTDLPFIDKKTLYKAKDTGNHRQWLTFGKKTSAFFCHICIAFSAGNSVFCSGFSDWRHIHQRLEEHESSKTHMAAVDTLIATTLGKNTYSLLYSKQLEKRKLEVKERRHIIGITIDVLKFLGKQGLPFRGSIESAFTLEDENINHGNFLEMIRFISKYDVSLQKHLEKAIEQSKLNHDRAEKRKEIEPRAREYVGRGSFVSLFGKNTVLAILHIIADEIKSQIAEDVKTADTFSIMMDTTQDISSMDQCAFVARFVNENNVFERLIALKPVTRTSSENLFTSLKQVLVDYGIPIKNCIANAFDGASNMSGQYNGVTAKLSEVVPNHLHTWCYAHVLNLVICDTAECTTATISFFGLLQKAQVFFKESFKRLQTFLAESPHFKLEAIGATRWRSRSDATVKIFGRINMWTAIPESATSKCVYLELVIALFKISNTPDFNTKVRSEAEALLKNFSAFETVFVAMMFLQIFKITTPVSDYLQTKDLDYAQAWRLVDSALQRLKSLRGKFDETVSAAKRFMSTQVENLNKKVNTDDCLESVELEEDFKEKRKRKVKKQAGEKCPHEHPMQTRQDEIKVEVFYRVLDTAIQVMKNRFVQHQNLYLDLSWFDPKRFNEKANNLPAQALDKVCELLPNVDKYRLKEELESFIHIWAKLNQNVSKHDYVGAVAERSDESGCWDEEFEQDNIEETETSVDGSQAQKDFVKCSAIKKCSSCIKCAFQVIFEYNMYSLQYTELHKVYKYLLTIPMTQVTCERVFSKVKIIKTRLRSTLTNENLESLILMSTEKDILNGINNEKVIKRLCETSSEMRRLLEV